jgi:hypothetical protein
MMPPSTAGTFGPQFFADPLLLRVGRVQLLFRPYLNFGARLHTGLEALNPNQHPARIIVFGILGVAIGRHLIVLLRLLEVLPMEVQISNPLDALNS